MIEMGRSGMGKCRPYAEPPELVLILGETHASPVGLPARGLCLRHDSFRVYPYTEVGVQCPYADLVRAQGALPKPARSESREDCVQRRQRTDHRRKV